MGEELELRDTREQELTGTGDPSIEQVEEEEEEATASPRKPTLGLGGQSPETDTSLGGGELSEGRKGGKGGRGGRGSKRRSPRRPKPRRRAPQTPREKAREQLAAFMKKTYQGTNLLPSTGRGAFDAEYIPAAGRLIITVKVDFQPEDDGNQKWGGGFLARLFGSGDREKKKWIASYKKAIAARWGGRYLMVSVKKYWESLSAATEVNVVEDAANPHFRLKVKKVADGTHDPSAAVTPPGGQNLTPRNPGQMGTFTGPGSVQLGSTDTTPTKDQWSANTATTEVARVKRAGPSRVLFGNNSTAVTDGAAKGKLKDMRAVLAQMKHPTLTVRLKGRASTTGQAAENLTLSQKRADAVEAALGSVGGHSVAKEALGSQGAGPEAEWRRVDVDVDALPPTFRNDYDVAGHEFGHMIGLGDEYQKSGGAEDSANLKLVEEAFGSKVAETYQKRRPGEDSASIMDGGLDVRPMHYVTFWEALGKITGPDMTRADWKIRT